MSANQPGCVCLLSTFCPNLPTIPILSGLAVLVRNSFTFVARPKGYILSITKNQCYYG